ncbi:MAG: LacI family DNA-binding transcriptional regulator, partial [Lentisphaeria bacterium]|nr:LacI family DNA-binding transcriptional regulator [Lentisphaeria bacterium]
AQCGLQVVFKELTEAMLEKINSCDDIDESFEVAGYLVTGLAPLRLHDILSTSMKPCVINGTFIGEEDIKCRIRFMEVRIDYAAIFRDIALQLLSLGHRKILLGHTGHGFMMRQIQQGVLEAVKQFDLPEETLTTKVYKVDVFNNTENVRHFANKLVNDAQNYSALLLPCGNIFGMETVNALRENKVSIPGDLSLVMVGYETDYFIPVLGISSIWADVRELGAFCIRELNRQVQSGRTEYGISYFSTTFIDRGSIDKAKN